MAASGDDMASEGGTQGNVTLQLQCRASSSAEDVKKLLEEKLGRQLPGYMVVFNGTEVMKSDFKIMFYSLLQCKALHVSVNCNPTKALYHVHIVLSISL